MQLSASSHYSPICNKAHFILSRTRANEFGPCPRALISQMKGAWVASSIACRGRQSLSRRSVSLLGYSWRHRAIGQHSIKGRVDLWKCWFSPSFSFSAKLQRNIVLFCSNILLTLAAIKLKCIIIQYNWKLHSLIVSVYDGNGMPTSIYDRVLDV